MFGLFTNIEILSEYFYGNTVGRYLEAFVLFLGLFVLFEIFQKLILSRLKKIAQKTRNSFDDVFVECAAKVKPMLYWVLAFYFASNYLVMPEHFDQALDVVLIFAVVIQIVVLINTVIDHFSGNKIRNNATSVSALKIILKISIWIVGFLFVLSNLGIDVTSLVAGLGIGGIAVALAVQNLLEDLFSSFVIYFDKPFEIGDAITTGEHTGTVEKIGIKTTRLRSLDGEEIVISNKELTSARIQNFKRLSERRILLNIGVAYETPHKVLNQIPKMIEEIIGSVKNVKFGRAHLFNLGESSIDFEVIYFVESDEYLDYMDANQSILSGILNKFEKEGIEIPYPKRVVFSKSSE